MANQKAFEMGLGIPGASAIIWYNDVNLRIGNAELTLPDNCEATIRIWKNGELVYFRAYIGPGTFSESVPGNERMVLVTDPAGDYYDLPSDITWSVNFAVFG